MRRQGEIRVRDIVLADSTRCHHNPPSALDSPWRFVGDVISVTNTHVQVKITESSRAVLKNTTRIFHKREVTVLLKQNGKATPNVRCVRTQVGEQEI